MATKPQASTPAPAQAKPVTARKVGITVALAAASVAIGLAYLRPDTVTVPALAPAQQGQAIVFDQERSFADLKKQVEFGARVPNSPGHRDCKNYLVEALKPLADRVETQDFSQRVNGSRLEMSNIIARWNGQGGADSAKSGVLLAAHWDTRPTADYEINPDKRKQPIPGANDGASGVAVLLEAARMFKRLAPSVPVMIVFFDGEDYGPGIGNMFLGSRYFAGHLPAGTPKQGILLDMVGDRDLVIPQETYSLEVAREVMTDVYAIAQRRGYGKQFPAIRGTPIEDDHIPLHEKGLKVIDLIDFSYGPGHSWWHTLEDTPDKCSPASLKAVGDVVLEWVYTRK
jgi:glutaminyl-peptide cyclotransferase